jgi:hypothetical protein
MEKLLSELNRLYLLPDSRAAQRGPGPAADLVSGAGLLRAIAIPFRKAPGADAEHWERLCTVANGLQADFGFPAPAVSVTRRGGFMLWLSLAAPVPVADARRFVAGLGRLWPDTLPPADTIGQPVELPPCANTATGTWAAFIHPGMGASFADESGLDMAPPAAGQVAFLEGLDSIAPGQFAQALARLEAPAAPVGAPPPPPAADGLLLKDATLEDIVRVLHARGIEPTFRFTLPR